MSKKKRPKISKSRVEEALEVGEKLTKKKTQPKTKKRENQKVLYVSEAHHLMAKKNGLLKGFSKLRDYIEYLIEKDN